MLTNPLARYNVTFTIHPGNGTAATTAARAAGRVTSQDARNGGATARVTALIGFDRLTPTVILLAILGALFWGAAHALSPGHGKTIVSAYLVGSRGTPWHAALLGLITTATHTAGVFALGGVTLLLSQWIVPDRLYPWLDLSAGLMVVCVGVTVLVGRARHAHAHRRGHGHDHHHHTHDHSARSLVAVGISGGLLPCPSALVVLLAAISLHRVAFGLLLVLAFSLGLAVAITCVGLAAVLAKRAFARFDGAGRVAALLPAISAAVIVVAGIAMTLRALPRVAL
jgi:ABC-type nickel/cobalt efflux system permease component RcnA